MYCGGYRPSFLVRVDGTKNQSPARDGLIELRSISGKGVLTDAVKMSRDTVVGLAYSSIADPDDATDGNSSGVPISGASSGGGWIRAVIARRGRISGLSDVAAAATAAAAGAMSGD